MTPSEIQAEIRQLTRQLKALRRKLPKGPSKAFKGRTRAEDRKARQEAHRKQTREIYQAAMRRCEGRCEMCDHGDRPLQLHHLISGSGRRRQRQSIENCMAICGFCHSMFHAGSIHVACAAEAWCKKHGYPIPDRVARAVAKLQAEMAAEAAGERKP
jgi:5-methylcytosine-specific restriction endonuclease McrA